MPWLVVVALVLAWMVSGRFGGRAVAEALDRASAAEAAVAFLVPQRDSIRAANVILTAAVDSARLVEDRARATTDSVRAASARRSATAARVAAEAADDLRGSLTASQAVQLGQIEAAWATVVEVKDAQIGALDAQVGTLERGIGARDALILGLRGELDTERAISAGLTDANEALHAAIRAQGRRTWMERAGVAIVVIVVGVIT